MKQLTGKKDVGKRGDGSLFGPGPLTSTKYEKDSNFSGTNKEPSPRLWEKSRKGG